MSHLTLKPTVRDYVKAELESEIPDPNSPDFEAFLDDLKETRPDLVEALVQGLEVEGAELPEEVQVRKAENREGRRNLFRWLFYSQNYEGEPSLNKRKTLFVIVGALVALLPIAFVVDMIAARRGTNVATSQVSEPPASSFQVVPVEPITIESQVPEALPSAPPRTPPEQSDLPPPPGPVDPNVAGAPPGSAAISSAPLTISGQGQAASPQPSALSFATESSLAPAALAIVELSPAPAQLSLMSAATSATGAPASDMPPANQSLSLVKGQVLTELESNRLSLLTEKALPEDASLTLVADPAPQASSTEANSEDSSQPLTLQETATPSNGQVTSSEPLNSANGTNLNSPSETAQTVTRTLQPGAQLPAKLVTGVVVTEGISSPVVAETPAEGEWCAEKPCPAITWLGTARLERPGRVSLRLEQAVINGEARAVSASAFGNDKLPGLAAAMSDASPTVFQDLLRAAAGGASDYLEALANQQKVTITEGNVVIEDLEVPSIDTFLLGRAAKLFDVPSDQTTVIRVAEVAPGTPLTVLVGIGD